MGQINNLGNSDWQEKIRRTSKSNGSAPKCDIYNYIKSRVKIKFLSKLMKARNIKVEEHPENRILSKECD